MSISNIFKHKKKPDSSLFQMSDFKTGQETINPFLAGQRDKAYKEAAEEAWGKHNKEIVKKKEEKKIIKNLKHSSYKQRLKPKAAPKKKYFLPEAPKGGRKKTKKRKKRK